MHIKWDVPKGLVHRFRDRLSVFFSGIKKYIFMNLQTAVLYFILGFCNHNERWICFSLHSGLDEL